MADSIQRENLSSATDPLPKKEIDINELKQFADLLIRIRQENNNDDKMKIVDETVNSLERPAHDKPFHKGTSYDRYIGRIALYLRANGTDLLHPWTSKKRDSKEKIDKRIESSRDTEGPWSDPINFPLKQAYWIRDFMSDLKRCFVEVDEKGNYEKQDKEGRYVLKSLTTKIPTHTFSVHFWHWTKYISSTKERLGSVVVGQLLIYNNWSSADFSYQLPGGAVIQYSASIWRAEKNYGGNRWQTQNFYLSFVSKPGETELLKQSSGLTMVLAVRLGHPDNTVLEGAFVAADPIYGYPASGRIFLINDAYLQPASDDGEEQLIDLAQQREELFAFARTYVAYQTQTAPVPNGGSFASLDEIPNFNQWRNHRQFLQKPLYGYCLQAVHDESNNQNKPHLGQFTLIVDNSDPNALEAPAQIQYHNSVGKPIDRGYVTIEQVDSGGLVVYRGEFHYLTDQQRFRYQIQFIRSKTSGSTWYIGTASGLNRHRSQLLAGRFVVRHTELDPKWLEPKHLADLLFHHEPTLGAFLLETDQQIPTETLPLYQLLKWPHLPRINHPVNELAFNKWVTGEYGCYALIRNLVNNKSHYSISFYPIKINKDGFFKIKCGVEKDSDGKEIAIEYDGRAFSAIDANRLYLYIDQADLRSHPFQAGFYFRIRAGEKLTSAYGISERFVNLDDPPEARFEALIELKDLTYEDANYRLYDPFSATDCEELNNQEPNLAMFLAGRANRLILANRHLHPNRPIPVQVRQDMFRRLHIRSALYEIEHGDYDNSDVLELIRDSYLHGFGVTQDEINFLNEKFGVKTPVYQTLRRWKTGQKILDEMAKFWPEFKHEPIHQSAT